MKRKALLTITGCAYKAFDNFSQREFIPFPISAPSWSDYTIENAFSLKVLLVAASGTDANSASYLASRALDALHPIDPFAYSGDDELWVALVRYDWPDAPEDWDKRTVVAGRWCDIADKAKVFLSDFPPNAHVTGIQAVSATGIARDVFTEARDRGLPEGEVHSVPEDLTGYPEWFKDAELKRRALMRDLWE